jgi:SAM-dependent methyltransferase
MTGSSFVTDAGNSSLHQFYWSNDESARLTVREGLVELIRTQRILRAALEPASRILDVGGADGVHADWLTTDGHEVEIVDVVPGHVERAEARGLAARQGDARALPHADGGFDVVLLLGPLYHLVEASDRAQALAEARRVLRPGGLVAAAAVTRLAVALNYLRDGRFGDPALDAVASRIVANGFDDTGTRPGIFYFHTVDELRG